MTRGRKIGLWITGSLVALLAVIVILALLAPLFIDRQEIRGKLQALAAERFKGQIDFEDLEVSFLPPHGTLTKVRLSDPGQGITGVADSVTAYLKILPLFKGSIRIDRVDLHGPDFKAVLPEIKTRPGNEHAAQSPLQNLAGTVYVGLSQLQKMRSDLSILIIDGKLTLMEDKKQIFEFQRVNGRLDLPPDRVMFKLHSASNIWESLSIDAQIDPSDMRGKGTINVTKLQPKSIADIVAADSSVGIGDSQINAKINFQMNGTPDLEGDVEASAPKLTIRRGETLVPLRIGSLKGKYHLGQHIEDITVTQMVSEYPAVKLSGRFQRDRAAPSTSVELVGSDVDVQTIRESALSLAGDLRIVQEAFQMVRGGTIHQMTATSRGKSISDLTETGNINVSAEVNQMNVYIQDLDLHVDTVTGIVLLSGGVLKVENFLAKVGNTQASQGDLTLGIQDENPVFHLDVNLAADLSQVPSALTGIVKDEDFLNELKRIRRVEGSAQAKLILGDRLDSVRTRVEIARMDMKGDHEKIPYPVEITDGRITYEGSRITWRNGAGAVGKSTFSNTEGLLDWADAPRIEATLDQGAADLGQIYPWISSVAEVKDPLPGIESLGGKFTLSSSRFQGPLGNPAEWKYEAKGRMEGVRIESPRLPGSVQISSGGIDASPGVLRFEQAGIAISDTTLEATGTVAGYVKGAPEIDAGFSGNIGPDVMKWIMDVIIRMPSELSIRAPLAVSGGHVSWGGGLETAFSGDFVIANGPRVSLDMTQAGQGKDLIVKDLDISGSDSRASIGMTLGEKVIDLRFNGNLTAAVTKQIFEKSENLNGWIRGDFAAQLQKERPENSTIQGDIEAGGITLLTDLTGKLGITSVSLKGSGKSLKVETADLLWRNMKMLIHGNVGVAADGLLVDLSIGSEGFTWEKVTRVVKQQKKKIEKGPEEKKGGFLEAVPVHGTIHVKADYFQYEDWRWEPFAFDLNFKGRKLDLKVTEGKLCSISTEATVKVSPEPMEMQAQAEAKGKDLKPTLSCFLDTRLVTGNFDSSGQVVSWGGAENFPQNLHGGFIIKAGEGRIYKFGLLSKILAVINITEIVKGQTPDLGGEGLGYKSANFDGDIEKGVIHLKEGYIDGRSMGLAFKGNIDLTNENLDLTVLVAPLKTVDSILRHIPLVSGIFGKDFIAIPVAVKGNWSDPTVIPLSPSAVGSELLGIVQRTLKLPFKIFQPLFGRKENKQ